jgi:NAD(P)-dependent dehydrogenase (short-subunit alcohol dehydrogenase family)
MTKKTVLITGAGGLIGSKVCKTLFEDFRLIAVDTNQCALDKLHLNEKKDLKLIKNICRDDDVNDLFVNEPSINTVVHCAYPKTHHYGQHWTNVSPNALQEELNAQLVSAYRIAKKSYQHFSNREGGQIILISSIYGSMSPRFHLYEQESFTLPIEYALIKAAVNQLIRYLASFSIDKEQPIIVQGIAPGGVAADQSDSFKHKYGKMALAPGMLDGQEVADCCRYLLTESGKTLHGHILTLDYGFSLS